jgi:DNA-binding NarL/FixJ family response regulator
MVNNAIGILIADDHPVVRMGVRNTLEAESGFSVVAEAADGNEAIRQVEAVRPDILLLDLSMPNMPGMETLHELMSRQTEVKTILLTASIDKPQVLQALQFGARGIITKNALPAELHACIRAVMDGKFWVLGTPVMNIAQLLQQLSAETSGTAKKTFGLTPRELQIASLIAEGCTNKDIAAECGIGEETVKHHLKRVFDKTGVSNRLELAVFVMNHALTRA